MKMIAAAVLVLSASSCILVVSDHGVERWRDRDSSSGPERTELRTVGEFHAIELRGRGDVRVELGPAQPIALTGGDAELPFLATEVQDGVLVIETRNGAPNSGRAVSIQVTTPALDAVSVLGSGNVKVERLAGREFSARISGSGGLRVTGQVERAEIALDGSGDAELFGLAARAVVVRLSGSGDVEVAPSETLDVSLAGSGDVRYHGKAKVSQRVQGSGSVVRDD